MKPSAKKLPKFARQAQDAMRLAVRQVIAEHRKTGEPLIIWRNGRVTRLAVGKPALNRPRRRRSR